MEIPDHMIVNSYHSRRAPQVCAQFERALACRTHWLEEDRTNNEYSSKPTRSRLLAKRTCAASAPIQFDKACESSIAPTLRNADPPSHTGVSLHIPSNSTALSSHIVSATVECMRCNTNALIREAERISCKAGAKNRSLMIELNFAD